MFSKKNTNQPEENQDMANDPLARFSTVEPTSPPSEASTFQAKKPAPKAKAKPVRSSISTTPPSDEDETEQDEPQEEEYEQDTATPESAPTQTPEEEPQEKQSSFKKAIHFLEKLQPISATDKLFFIQHLGVMMRAGIPLATALDALAKQTKNPRLTAILTKAQKRVLSGEPLSNALEEHSKVFDTLFISMIRIGETGGMLEDVLKQLYVRLKKEHQLIGRVRGALAYPVVVLIAMVGIGIGVIVFVVPQFISIFAEVELELPLMTRILIAVSETIRNYGIFVAGAAIALIVAFITTIRTPKGKWYFHGILLSLPIMGTIIKKINLARFCRTLSSLLTTDIKIVESVSITADTLGNVHYQHAVNEAAERIGKGREINKVLAEYPKLFNHVTLQMISVGEESGQVDEVLAELAQFYEEEIEEVMNTLPSIIEPIIIIILAVGIGGMAIAIITPMFELTNAF